MITYYIIIHYTFFETLCIRYSVASSYFFNPVTTTVYLIVKCYQNNSWYDGWIKAIKAQALLKAPTHPHKNEEESEGLGTSTSLILIGYTRITWQHVGDGAGAPCWECEHILATTSPAEGEREKKKKLFIRTYSLIKH